MKILKFIILSFVFISTTLNADYDSLTPDERSFLERTTEIKCVTTDTWAPFNISRKDGSLVGISIDYWDIISKEINLNGAKCQVLDTFEEVLDAIKTKKADITLSTSITKDRLEYAIFTEPYDSFPIVIATRDNINFISNTQALIGKKVAVGKGFTSAKYMQNKYKNIDYVEVKNIDEALILLASGEVYAVVEVLPVLAYLISNSGYTNIKISGKTEFMFDVRMMVRKDYPELVSVINHEIDEISKVQRDKILEGWFSVEYTAKVNYEFIGYLIIIILLIIIFWIMRERGVRSYNQKLNELLRKLENQNELLKKQSITDTLTGLYNRFKIDEVLSSNVDMAKRYDQEFSVILLDIDKFKDVNDEYGHLVGDEVLKEFAKIIKNNIRKTDIVGRWGGEEFMIISSKTDSVGCFKLANNLKNKINENVFGEIGTITASYGVAQYEIEDSMESLVAKADKALYNAKESGRNMIVCNI